MHNQRSTNGFVGLPSVIVSQLDAGGRGVKHFDRYATVLLCVKVYMFPRVYRTATVLCHHAVLCKSVDCVASMPHSHLTLPHSSSSVTSPLLAHCCAYCFRVMHSASFWMTAWLSLRSRVLTRQAPEARCAQVISKSTPTSPTSLPTQAAFVLGVGAVLPITQCPMFL